MKISDILANTKIPKSLRRLIALDFELACRKDYSGVNLKQFARRWRVNVATVHRDVETLRALGAQIGSNRPFEGSNEVWRGYKLGSVPLFTINYRKPNNRLSPG